jgi:hypothetical protein
VSSGRVDACAELERALRDDGVTNLDLSSGCSTELQLEANEIGDSGAAAVGKFLRGSAAGSELVDLSWNVFGRKGVAALADALRYNTTVKELLLAGNPGVDSSEEGSSEAEALAGAESLVIAINGNTTLETVLINYDCTDPYQMMIDAALADTDRRARGRERFLQEQRAASAPTPLTATIVVAEGDLPGLPAEIWRRVLVAAARALCDDAVDSLREGDAYRLPEREVARLGLVCRLFSEIVGERGDEIWLEVLWSLWGVVSVEDAVTRLGLEYSEGKNGSSVDSASIWRDARPSHVVQTLFHLSFPALPLWDGTPAFPDEVATAGSGRVPCVSCRKPTTWRFPLRSYSAAVVDWLSRRRRACADSLVCGGCFLLGERRTGDEFPLLALPVPIPDGELRSIKAPASLMTSTSNGRTSATKLVFRRGVLRVSQSPAELLRQAVEPLRVFDRAFAAPATPDLSTFSLSDRDSVEYSLGDMCGKAAYSSGAADLVVGSGSANALAGGALGSATDSCTWWKLKNTYEAPNNWFKMVFWDYSTVVVRGDGQTVVAFSATDSD